VSACGRARTLCAGVVAMKVIHDRIALPRIDEVPRSVALGAFGRALAATYAGVLDEPVPASLVEIASHVSEKEEEHGTGLPSSASRGRR
jgi:hypothetical protein